MVSQKLTRERFSPSVFPGRETALSGFARPTAADLPQGDVSWVRTKNGCGWCCPQCGVRKRQGATRTSRGAPVVHESTAELRLPRWVFSRRGCCVDSYNSWVSTNNGYGDCCPQCGVRTIPDIGGRAPIMGLGVVVRNAESAWASRFSGGGAVAGWLCTNRRWVRVSPGGFSVGGGVVSIRTVRGYPPTMGMGVVVRDAESARGSPAGLVSQKLTRERFSLAVFPGRETALSAFTRPPPPRQQTR